MSTNPYGQPQPYGPSPNQPSHGLPPETPRQAPAPRSQPSFADPYEATMLAQPAPPPAQPTYANPPSTALAPINQPAPGGQYGQPGPGPQPGTPYGAPGPIPGSGYGSPAGQAPYLVRIGSMVVTETEVHTPAGTIPLNQATFTFADQSYSVRKTPGWAIALAIIGFFIVTVLSLLFLLIKETQTTGHVVVGVHGPGGMNFAEPMPVQNLMQVQDAASRINYANQLAAGW